MDHPGAKAAAPQAGHPADRHLLLAFPGERPPPALLARVATGTVPGVSLFPRANIADVAQTRDLVDQLQAARPDGAPPLLVGADQEGGQHAALGEESTGFAGNLALGATGDADLAERVGRAMGLEARAAGINVVYAPACDLLDEPSAAGLGVRSFGDDPDAVGELAAAVVRGLESAGVAATLKHFPGLGAVTEDTHHHLGVVTGDRQRLDARELAPFRAALGAAPRMVMSAHVAVPALTGSDELPATLARAVMHDLLRGELGFDGVSITDALDMRALSQGAGALVDGIAALLAGVDLLLCTTDEQANDRLREGLRLAWRRGLLPTAALERSARRIESLRAGLAGDAPTLEVIGGSQHRRLADELAARSVTLLRDTGGLLPLRPGPDDEVLVLQPAPRDLTPADSTASVAPVLADALADRFERVGAVVHPDPPDAATIARITERARAAAVVVLGTSAAHLEPAQAELARAVMATGTATVHVMLRTPFDVTVVPEAATVLCTYGIRGPSLRALAAVLHGDAEAPGRLPVHVDQRHPRGAGAAPR